MIVIALIILSAFHPPSCGAYDGVVATGEKGKQIVELVKRLHEAEDFTGAVLAAENGQVIAAVAAGRSLGKPLTPETLFELASCTKPFTAVAVMKLVEEGKLALDDSISKWLPGVPEDSRGITVRHLLQHTSGIPGSNAQGGGTELAAVLPTFLAGGPRTPPGERHEYWNQGYALLSEIIARAAGKTYTAYCQEAIFNPCQMKGARFTGQKAPRGALVAVGKSTHGAPRSALDHPYGEYGFQYRGMGGLAVSLLDLWHFDRALAAGKLLSKDSIQQMTAPGPDNYGLGWRIEEIKPGHVVHAHTGSVRGFLASITRDPQLDGALFVLANSDDPTPFDRVCEECTAVLWDLPAEESLAEELLDKLIGHYQDSRGRTLIVSREGRRVAALIDWGGPKSGGYLTPGDGGSLSFNMLKAGRLTPMNEIKIERTSQGEISGLTITDLQPPLMFERSN